MSQDYDVLVIGSCIVDFISYVPRLPKEGETLHGTKFCTGFGGKGANQAVAAQRLGCRTAIMGKLGNDSSGRDYKEQLKKEGVFTEFLELIDGESTGIAQICVSNDAANTIVIVVGANNRLSIKDVEDNQNLLDKSKVLLCQLETPVSTTIKALSNFPGISILNAAPAIEDPPKELLEKPSIFCVNETEASLLTKLEVGTIQEAKSAVKKLKEMGCKTVILTMGAQGVVYLEDNADKIFHVEIPKLDIVVDSTGAGDAFIGALAFYLTRENVGSMGTAIGKACSYASLSVQKMGTQTSFAKGNELPEQQLFELIEI